MALRKRLSSKGGGVKSSDEILDTLEPQKPKAIFGIRRKLTLKWDNDSPDSDRNYYKKDFITLLLENQLNATSLQIMLCMYQRSNRTEWTKPISYQEICRIIGKDDSVVSDAIGILKAKNLLEVKATYRGANKYKVKKEEIIYTS